MQSQHEEFTALLTELLKIPAPPAREERMAAAVMEKLNAMGYANEIDPAGNVIVRLCTDKNAPLTVIAAHLDEIAMTVRAINADGSLKLTHSGGLLPAKLGESPVEIISDRDETITGVFSMGSTHTMEAKSGKWTPDYENCLVHTGLTPAQLKEKGIRVGSPVVPAREVRGPYIFGDEKDPMIGAWTFDDRAGIVELLMLLKNLKSKKIKVKGNYLFAFTVEEEGGCYGARILADREKPQIFIAVDGCPVVDPDVLKLDGRPGIWSKDMICNYDQQLIRDFLELGEKTGNELQPVVYESAASDASMVYQSGGTYRPAFVGHVRTNSHGFEVARLSVFANVVKLLTDYLKNN